ncbi:MAG: hypothetical protein IPG94_20170 [Kineosporiaceae bacterium]|nr:hypothetical protein [Kineosporiaceae bacterium]
MAEKWRRCDRCRKVKPVDDFAGAEPSCQGCLAPVTTGTPRTSARASAVTTTRAASTAAGSVGVLLGTPIRDLRGKGDPEVRSRRARVRALDRLAERYAEDFDLFLAEERRAEGF